MKKTLLKRKTPLKRYKPLKGYVKLKAKKKLVQKVGLKRTPMKHKPKRFPIPKEELAKVDERASCRCEYHDNQDDCLGRLEYAHIIHRKMGGVQGEFAKIINDHRNITKICTWIHDFIDKRSISEQRYDVLRNEVIEQLKKKIQWYSWYEENKDVINR